MSVPAALTPAPPFVLATDLDGTLLGGSDEERQSLLDTLDGALTIFVTGRGLETVRPLFWDPLVPKPKYVIADVGATIVEVVDERFVPVQPLQANIEARWPGTLEVIDRLARFEGLVRQDVPQERRCSYLYTSDAAVTPELNATVEALGCDLILSAGRYLDVMPKGVSKGPTLLALVDHLGLDPKRVLVAGDTLNDRSMFDTGLLGVVVHNAEPALVDHVARRDTVHVADGVGAAGIEEALTKHGWVDPQPRTPTLDLEGAQSQLVMVYHRLPFEEYRRNGKTFRRRPKSPNGIIPSLLGFFANGRAGAWVGWSLQDSRDPDDFERTVPVADEYAGLEAARIALTKDDVDRFYKRFSKEAFWPVIFSFPGRAVFDASMWETFVDVNRAFAERTAEEAKPNALVWVHDYNLWLVPGMLRQLRADVKIGFFHHTSFPPSDVFNMLPWREHIVGSLAQCDYVGFHIPRYLENFVDVLQSNAPTQVVDRVPCAPRFVTYGCALGIDQMATAIDVGGRRVHLGAHPVGIDCQRIRELVARDDVAQRIEQIRGELEGRTAIVSIERLDYVKGPLEKIEAFGQLLEEHPELHGKVVLINFVTPPASGMRIYKTLNDKLDQAVGQLNGRFGRLDWTPVRYFLRSLPFEDVVAHYAASDVAWITPLRDGLNLVAKEYVMAKAATNTKGALVLSEFAGAAVEMHGALLANPFDLSSMKNALMHALTMSDDERGQRQRRMQQIVEYNDVRRWGDGFLEGLEGANA